MSRATGALFAALARGVPRLRDRGLGRPGRRSRAGGRRVPLPRRARRASCSSRCSRTAAGAMRARATTTTTNLPPRHAYVAFYLWLRHVEAIHALVHCGTHGTLEWLPGKAVALDAGLRAGSRARPPAGHLSLHRQQSRRGRAGQAPARRRHASAISRRRWSKPASTARRRRSRRCSTNTPSPQSLDPRRARLLAQAILDSASETGLADEAGLDADRSPIRARSHELDAWLCDLKDMRIGDGLHVFGRAAAGVRARRRPCRHDPIVRRRRQRASRPCSTPAPPPRPPACSPRSTAASCRPARPARRRAAALDVLPTGRNLYTVDPRAVPTRTAWEIGKRTADEVVARYAQDHGDWPRPHRHRPLGQRHHAHRRRRSRAGVGADRRRGPYGTTPRPASPASRSCRCASARPAARRRDAAHLRPVPRRVPDADRAVRRGGARRRRARRGRADNPLAAARRALARRRRTASSAPRPAPTASASAAPRRAGDWTDTGRARRGLSRRQRPRLWTRRGGRDAAEAFREPCRERRRLRPCAGHGRARTCSIPTPSPSTRAASPPPPRCWARAGAATTPTPTGPASPVVRTLAEEIARVLRGRATNPRWIAGQMRHGHRGAARDRRDRRQPLRLGGHRRTSCEPASSTCCSTRHCGDERVRALPDGLPTPAAAASIARRFDEALRRGLWRSRRNSVGPILAA